MVESPQRGNVANNNNAAWAANENIAHMFFGVA